MLRIDTVSAIVKKRKRVGRGGSRGGTSCKGGKGQTARSGGSIKPGFEGGQMPLHRRLPKRGFVNSSFAKEVIAINISDLERAGKTDQTIDRNFMLENGLIKIRNKSTVIVKVLGDGALTKKLHVIADAFSARAKQEIERLGGSAEVHGQKE